MKKMRETKSFLASSWKGVRVRERKNEKLKEIGRESLFYIKIYTLWRDKQITREREREREKNTLK
jgi:hypothetical protein